MNKKEFIANIKSMFSLIETEKVNLAEYELVSGGFVSVNEQTGEAVLKTVTSEGTGSEVPVPVGEHETLDGQIIVVTEEGAIAEIKPKPEAPVEEVAEVQETEDEDMIAIMQAFEMLNSRIMLLEEKVASMESASTEMMSKVEKFSALPATQPIKINASQKSEQPLTVAER